MSCRNSGCNYQSCSLSQKVSIGMFAESVAKSRCGSMKEADVPITRAEKEAVDAEHLMVNHNAQRRVKASGTFSMRENDIQEGSVRVTSGSLAPNLMMKDSDHTVNHASGPGTSNLHANKSMRELGVSNKAEAERTSGKELENRSKEALRMKLREILGTGIVPSGDIPGDSKTHEVNANEIRREETVKGEAHFNARQNSDTIETDSENVGVKIKRPVTRSLPRRRAPVKMRPRKLKSNSVSSNKEGNQGADIFSFAEKPAPSPPCAVKRVCSILEKNGVAKRSCGIKPGDKLSPVADLRNIQPEIIGCEKGQPAEELPSVGGEKSTKHGCLDENLGPEAEMQNFSHSPVAREKSQLPTPAPQDKSEHPEPNVDQSPVHHADGLNCQWFKVTKPVLNSPMGLYPLRKDKKQGFQESVQQEGGAVPKAKCFSASSEKEISEFSDDADKLNDSLASTPRPSSEEKNAGNRPVTPVTGDLDSTQEVSSVYPEVDDVYTSPEIRLAGKPMLFRSKRHCNLGVDFSDLSPSLTPKSSRKDEDPLMCFDESPEDGLSRVVSLLSSALDKITNKVISVTNKKCSEILMSAAEEIHSLLRSVESQIQTDLGKLTDLKTTKRKHLETRLQEQKQHLKVMHEKFKEEICQYLQDCQGAVDGMETQHIELQGAIEKQKALHRKLLLQTEAAVETHLIDAQRQMMFVRKLGKQKMQQLKVTVTECLKDEVTH